MKMKKIKAHDIIRVAEIWHSQLSAETLILLNRHFIEFMRPNKADSIFNILDFSIKLMDEHIEVSDTCRKELQQLYELCHKRNTPHIRIIFTTGEFRNLPFGPAGWRDLAYVTAILSPLFIPGNEISSSLKQTIEAVINHAVTFVQQYGFIISTKSSQDWESVITEYGRRIIREQESG